jgi:hypothetical protein
MNTLTEAIHDYVGMRQSLGFKLLQVEAYLKDFAAFMDTADSNDCGQRFKLIADSHSN